MQEEFSHLLKGLACPDKLADLVEKLQSSSSAGCFPEYASQALVRSKVSLACDQFSLWESNGPIPTALMQEVITWQDSVLTWCDKMKRSYPFYLDVLQPVFLALSESCYGLDQLLAASQSQSGYLSPKDAKKMETVISSLMGFPPTLPTSTKASQVLPIHNENLHSSPMQRTFSHFQL